MDITTFFIEKNLASPLFLLSAFAFIVFIGKQTKVLYSNKLKKLPPGPPQLPIIGNLHQVGLKPHISTANFAKQYGPLISLRLGQQLLVVASSPDAAKEILKTQDRVLSSRTVPTAFQQPSLIPHSFIWSDCNDSWKALRTLTRTQMFSAKAMEAQSRLREEKLGQLIGFLDRKQGQVINIEKVVFTTLFNTLSSSVFDKDLLDLNIEHSNEHAKGSELKESLLNIIEYGGRTRDFGSFFPMFESLDVQGILKGSTENIKKVHASWEDIIEERRTEVNSTTWCSEQATSFLDRLLENRFSNNQINQLVTELFIAGTNTTSTALIWAMSELIKNKEIMHKLKEEMNKEIGSEKISESHLSKLPYLHAIVKETLRLHPPVPFLLPRKAAQTCEVMDYTIPKNTRIFVNVWAMGRDPKVWEDPLSFKPKRFLNSKHDFRGQDFDLLPFGSGRRICPGLPLGVMSLELLLASLIHEFDWVLPNCDDPMELDMNENFGIAMKREIPLELILTKKT